MLSALLATVLLAATSATPVCIAPDGATITLELAVTDRDRALGLMFRDSLPPDRGMLFLFESEGIYPFWMKNTFIPLDIIWLDGAGTVVEIKPSLPPCQTVECPQYVPTERATAVLELIGGGAAAHGIAPGVRLRFENVRGYPVKGARP